MDKGRDFVTYIDRPSLKSAVMTKIVAKLWEIQFSQQNINFQTKYKRDYDSDEDFEDPYHPSGFCINFTLMKDCREYDHDHDDHIVRYHDFPVMEKEVMNRLLALRLPKKIEREILRYVMHIGEKYLGWIDPQYFRFGLHSSKHICWTSEGPVNVSETIRSVYDCQKMDMRMFMAISNACLEDLVKKAYKRLSKLDKDIERTYGLCWDHKYDAHLVVYWLCFCKKDFSRLFEIISETDDYSIYGHNHSMFRNMFSLSIHTGNNLAAKYFWPKLTEEEKNANMMVWIDSLLESMDYNDDWEYYGRKDGFLDIFFFLLGEMNDSAQQRQVFQKHEDTIIHLLIFDWPWQKYLLQTITVMFSFMEEIDYVNFIGELIFNVGKGRVIEKLFSDVWHESPSNFKMGFVEHMMEYSSAREDAFRDLFDIHDLHNIKLITSFITEAEKRVFISCGIQSSMFISSAINNLDVADDFLKETLPSESDLNECKALIVKYLKDPSVRHLLDDHDRKATEIFLKWCLVSESEMQLFKEDIGLKTIGKETS